MKRNLHDEREKKKRDLHNCMGKGYITGYITYTYTLLALGNLFLLFFFSFFFFISNHNFSFFANSFERQEIVALFFLGYGYGYDF